MASATQQLPEVWLKTGCTAVQQDSSPSIWKGPLSETTHLHPYVPHPDEDTQVILNIISGQKTLGLKADLRDTGDQIKKRIKTEGKFGALESITLLCGNQEVQGSKTLQEQGVQNLAQLFIVHKCMGG
ncbi:hypothetical protein Y1Q_0006429 [Alligator mississippiensis]|uniref:Ubiquitin-like domain-containing protein n=1 Tax=Alligator mississippiensis TaxID=8496 RepID=A0A151NY11_ALLMI|nr:hypothetical protein Y1Q_0006429 [Alligator mississippiensis]